MPQPTPADYDKIKVPFYQLAVGDKLEVEPGFLEKIIRKTSSRSFESVAITESGRLRITGYGVRQFISS